MDIGNGINERNEREKNIVSLINQLSEYANDENSTQEAINAILAQINQKTQENHDANMKLVEELENRPVPEFPSMHMSQEIKNAIEEEKRRVMGEYAVEQKQPDPLQPLGQLIFTRIREVKAPGKAHPTDAGIDFYVPDEKAWDDDFKKKVVEYSRNSGNGDVYFQYTDPKGVELVVKPNAHVAIPGGIKTIIPTGLGVMMVNKSGIATKLKLDHSACLIDSEYRDEWIFCFFNHNNEPVRITPGMKLTQGLVVPIINLDIHEVLNCVYDDLGKSTDRGGGFGSSGQ